ncbi:hypothetical protein BJF83_21375 [Nocardiopsis sp. CNR-923]|uniref:hypothetical protein n=1 Tax=Nocardiopsis sp. CNR-923 TaxID=1904965 RepID=UPI000961812E|nr:hypothetical protein [Nocardiopsis sp. CNR-923]OLT26354.1 hypothetical protein BJF83_21375 [Nocardiopsis sp. CNR-923]
MRVPAHLLPTYEPQGTTLIRHVTFHRDPIAVLATGLTHERTRQAATALNAAVAAGVAHGPCDTMREISRLLSPAEEEVTLGHLDYRVERDEHRAWLVGGRDDQIPTVVLGGPRRSTFHPAEDVRHELDYAFGLGQTAAVVAPPCWDCGADPGTVCAAECRQELPRVLPPGLRPIAS